MDQIRSNFNKTGSKLKKIVNFLTSRCNFDGDIINSLLTSIEGWSPGFRGANITFRIANRTEFLKRINNKKSSNWYYGLNFKLGFRMGPSNYFFAIWDITLIMLTILHSDWFYLYVFCISFDLIYNPISNLIILK